ncbi:MAG: lysostaphin resistance A-like protein [Crocinitomicaceae bacterium]
MIKRHWQETFILIFSLLFTTLISSLVLSIFVKPIVGVNSGVNTYILSAIVSQIVIFGGATILYFKITKLEFGTYINIAKPTKNGLFLTLLAFITAVLVIVLFSPLIEWFKNTFANHQWVLHQLEVTKVQTEVLSNFRGYKLPIALLVLALLPAIFEELVFRGILYRLIKDISGNAILSIFLSGLLFSLIHFQALSFLPIAIVGFLLAYLYEKTNNLTHSILLHFAFNAIQIIFWQA